jgi:nucleotide-binding universal stress UspA family protein
MNPWRIYGLSAVPLEVWMFERILVPLDGSGLAESVLPHARELAARFNSELILLQVLESAPRMLGESNAPGVPEESTRTVQDEHARTVEDARRYLETVLAGAGGDGFERRTEVVSGQPAETILEYAERANVSLICLSSHGRGGIGRLVFGSVADHVIQNSSIPLLLLRPAE